jgi:FMN phosphatase YigB (HAD superfamily)
MKEIKCFIFDQDGTFYPENSELTNILREKTKKWIMDRLSLDKKEVDDLYKKLPKRYPNALEGFQSLGLSIKDYHKNVFDIVDPAKYLQKDNKLISVLEKLKGKKFIVTFSSKKYSMALQISLGINSLIKKTYYSINFLPETSKLFIYDFIREENKLEKEEVLVIGNNLDVDIIPALNEGYRVALIGEPVRDIKVKSIKNVYNLLDINKG